MKEQIDVNEYAQVITDALGHGGVLLNTNGEKFNSMVIGWAGLGRVWNLSAFTVYVREHRYTKAQLDATREFTVSAPLEGQGPVPHIAKVCGTMSGRDVDKVADAGLTLEEPLVIRTPGVREYPLTLECRVLYAQPQDLDLIPADLRATFYPEGVDWHDPMANSDPHTAYIGQIVGAYIIR